MIGPMKAQRSIRNETKASSGRRLALGDRRALLDLTGREHAGHLEFHEIAAAQLAVDRRVE